MTIAIPADAGIPTRGIDALVEEDAQSADLIAFGKGIELKYERLKLVHDNLLTNTTYAPLLAADVSDDETLKQMILEAGWVINFDETFGTPEELGMWLNRFRRFRAAVVATVK